MSSLSPEPRVILLALVGIWFSLLSFAAWPKVSQKLVLTLIYATAYVVLSAIGQSEGTLGEYGLWGLVAGILGCFSWALVVREIPNGSIGSRRFWALGMIGLGLLTALFSGPQGGAGKFVYFLEHTLHLSEQAAMIVNFTVRKTLHLSVYGTLGASAGVIALRQGARLPRVWLAGLSWGIVHAVLDEMTQSKSSVRTGSPWDVLLDTVGMTIGLSLVTVMRSRSLRRLTGVPK